MKLAGIYSDDASIQLKGHLSQIDFSSIGTGHWVFELTASSSNNSKIQLESMYEFSSAFVADRACQQVAQAFSPVVQKLIGDFVRHPDFQIY